MKKEEIINELKEKVKQQAESINKCLELCSKVDISSRMIDDD